MFSRTIEYALRAVLCLGDRGTGPQTTRELARRTGVPAAYLSKVLRCLGRAKLVCAQRGLHGGYTLARPAAEMTVWDVFQAVSPVPPPGECPLGGCGMPCRGRCPLRRPLVDLSRQVEQLFRGTRVADVLGSPALVGPEPAGPEGARRCGEAASAKGPC
jgi:Rrf2 family protein